MICAPGPGGGPNVVVFTDSDGDRAVSDNPVVESFFAYAPNFTGGVYVASGPIQGAGGVGAELITGPGAGGGPHVRVFTDSNATGKVADNAEFESFFAYGGFTGGR